MTALLPRLFSDLTDWLDFDTSQSGGLIRLEDLLTDTEYQLRAELPGMKPEKDIKVTVDHGVLTIQAERLAQEAAKRHSEFRYGMLRRTVRLPAGAVEEKITATYDNGILTVTVPIGTPEPHGRTVPVKPRAR